MKNGKGFPISGKPSKRFYMFVVPKNDFLEFIKALYEGKEGAFLCHSGALVTRTLRITGKYCFNSYSKIGVFSVGFASLTATLNTCKKLYDEYLR